MASGRAAVVGLLLAALFAIFKGNFFGEKRPYHFGGQVLDKRFQHVEDVFRQNFVDGWERDGSSFTLYHKGKKVVDLWGGYADTSALRKWERDTISVTFSSSKAVGALCVAVLKDRGHLNYDDLLTKYWPGFGKHGKGNVTVQWALSHMAGLAWIDKTITYEDALDHNRMRQILEDQKPNWPPGTATGYHAFTYGWIVDQIIRHADPQNRGVGQFFREEISHKHDIDYHFGLPKEQQYRVARMTLPPILSSLGEVVTDYRVARFFIGLVKLHSDTMLAKVVKNPEWMNVVDHISLNNPDYHRLEQPAVLGMGNGRSLADLFNLVLRGKIISKETLLEISKPFVEQQDMIMDDPVGKGYGFLFHPMQRPGENHGRLLGGHPGYGGQNVKFDLHNDIVMGYVGNGLKTGLGDLTRTYSRLREAVYDVLEGKV